MVKISLEQFGDVQLSRELLRFRDRGQDMSPAFEEAAVLFLEFEDQQFARQGAVGGRGKWPALNPRYAAWKRRKGYDRRILHRTLRLRSSLTFAGHPDHVRRIRPDELFVGTSVPYAGAHQNPRKGRLPRRRPVDLTERQRRQMVKVLQRFLVEG